MKNYSILLVLAVAVVIGLVSQSGAQEKPEAKSDNIVQAITLPYKKYDLHFKAMGLINKVSVEEGDTVKTGDLLMALNADEEKAELAILELDAVNENNIKASEREHKLRDVLYKWALNINKNGGKNDRELAENEAQERIAAIKIDQAKDEKKLAELKRDRQAKHIELMELKAPTDGIVAELHSDIGATVDPTKPSLTIVQNNPLKVEVQVPGLASLQVKPGDKMKVSYDQKNWLDATVSFMSPVADAASGMRKINLELPNPEQNPSGLQVFVELPSKLLAAQ